MSEATTKPTVLLADSQPAARATLRALLERDGFAICAEAADRAGAEEQAAHERPDVCMVDLALPGDGVAAIRAILEASPETAVIAFTTSNDPEDLFAAIRAGAVGYLLKDINPERVSHAVRGVLAGEAAIPRALVALLVGELQSQGNRRLVIGAKGRTYLSKRESEVAGLLSAGAGTAVIAERLFISPVTVRRHVSAIVEKLGVADRAAAVRLLAGDPQGHAAD